MRIPLTEDQCNKIYDILVEIGASKSKHDRDAFVLYYTSNDPPSEWRFMGRLGFGGKFRYYNTTGHQLFLVDCYREDETPERRSLIDETNQKLKPFSDTIIEAMNAVWRARLEKSKESNACQS